jgi:lysophospholipase L1-like esterase
MKKTVSVSIMVILTAMMNLYAAVIIPNPIISRGKTVATSSGGASYLVDNNFTATNFNVANNTWIAINIGIGYSSVYLSWNNPSYTWSDVSAAAGSCKSKPSMAINYAIQTSANSTNGTDGAWTTVTTVTGNNVTARGHVIDFTGASWIKMNITTGSGQINEVEVFDLSSSGTDLWFFPGTSISANTYKGTPPAQDYADLIKASYPTFTPVMVRGGIPCINSTQFKNDINLYLANAGNVKYWAIEMGTNDAWGGSNAGVPTFKSNLQAIITACKNAGIQPMIARMLSTNASLANWQVHPDYLKAIDDLTTQNNLIPGPDLYTYFLSHSSEQNSDGVHPNATGAASIQRLWAQKMGPLLYSSPLNPTPTVTITSPVNASSVCAGNTITINATATISSGTISKVDFYDGNTLLGTDNSSPFVYTWNGASAGTHTVRTIGTSTAGMASSDASISITVNTLPIIDHYVQTDGGNWNQITRVDLCSGSTLALGPHPITNTGWSWMGPNGYTSAAREITLSSIAVSQRGTYTASYTDANGCTSKSPITIIVNGLPNAPSVSSTVTYCQNASSSALSGTGTGLKWYTAASGGTALATAPTPTTASTGITNYYVSQTTNTCESSRSLIAVTVNALPNASISSSTATTFCTGGSVVLTASTGSSYTWMNGNTQVGTAATYLATTAGNYTVEVTNTSTCKAISAAIIVTVNTLPSAPIVNTPIIYCQNAIAIPLTAIGTELKWYTVASGGTALNNVPIPITTAIGTTNYYVSQTTNGCLGARSSIAVTVNALPSATISSSTLTTFCTGGSVVLTSGGGSLYKWMNGNTEVGTAATYLATTAGNYTVEVTNASNCKDTSAATIVTVTTPITWFADIDNDGKGDPFNKLDACTQPSGYVSIAGDACPTDPNKIDPGNCGCGKTETSCLDCTGTPNGTASLDNCKICVGGTTGNTACLSTATINGTTANITVIPQPFDLNTSIQLENQGNIQSITIISASGAIVKTIQEVNTNEITLGEDLASGLYSVIIQSEKGMVVTKIVKK